MSDRLVLADRPVEDDALLGVLDAALERGPPDADRLDAGKDALRVRLGIIKGPQAYPVNSERYQG
jgi:hypothetical protein